MNIEETAAEIIDTVFSCMKERRSLSPDERQHLDRLIMEVERYVYE